jgi:hypothetical protein
MWVALCGCAMGAALCCASSLRQWGGRHAKPRAADAWGLLVEIFLFSSPSQPYLRFVRLSLPKQLVWSVSQSRAFTVTTVLGVSRFIEGKVVAKTGNISSMTCNRTVVQAQLLCHLDDFHYCEGAKTKKQFIWTSIYENTTSCE